jgi:hypothetical protein
MQAESSKLKVKINPAYNSRDFADNFIGHSIASLAEKEMAKPFNRFLSKIWSRIEKI